MPSSASEPSIRYFVRGSNGQTNGLTIDVIHNATIDSGGRLDVSGKGYATNAGPGTGVSDGSDSGGGGGYGGDGGRGIYGAAGGATYGSITQPTELGSAGGRGYTAGTIGALGGGALRMTVGGTLTVNGAIAANGNTGIESGGRWGGGSGGSVWITAATLTGTGTISANGGNVTNCCAGGGGGGRVAIYACVLGIPIANIQANGGPAGARSGQLGTIYFDPTALTVSQTFVSGASCPGSSVRFSAVTPSGSNFAWHRDGVPLNDGPGLGTTVFSGATTADLFISNISPADGVASYSVSCTNACGNVTSGPSTLTLCVGDIDCDGDADSDDVLAFFSSWDNGDSSGDTDGDGDTDSDDIITFFTAWDAGC